MTGELAGQVAGKVVLVAGASSGMGRAVASLLARQGAQVALLARRAAVIEAAAGDIRAAGGAAIACAADATDDVAVSAAVQQTVDAFGRLDALVNCVGTNIRLRSLDVLTAAAWREVLRTNLDAGFVLTQAVLPVFRRQQDGLLIHLSSSAAKRADLAGVAYHASKAGIVGLAHATMEEARADGVRVSVVFPGLTDTPLVAQRPAPVPAEMLANALQPDDVASVCAALIALPGRAYVPELLLYPSRL